MKIETPGTGTRAPAGVATRCRIGLCAVAAPGCQNESLTPGCFTDSEDWCWHGNCLKSGNRYMTCGSEAAGEACVVSAAVIFGLSRVSRLEVAMKSDVVSGGAMPEGR